MHVFWQLDFKWILGGSWRAPGSILEALGLDFKGSDASFLEDFASGRLPSIALLLKPSVGRRQRSNF